MLKSMISFGITEDLQISASLPVATTSGTLPGARMMSLMSNERELEVLTGYRFPRRVVGVGGRQESTVYAGGTVPLESTRGGVQASPSLYLGAATGYASRSGVYVWVGGGLQHFTERHGDQLGDGRFASVVYGFRPKPLRVEAHKPDARVFIEATAEDREADRVAGVQQPTAARSVFVGPTTLILYKAFAFEGGVLIPAYQRVDAGRSKERLRVAVNVSYFFWLKSEVRDEKDGFCAGRRHAGGDIRACRVASRRNHDAGHGLRNLRPRRERGYAEGFRRQDGAREPQRRVDGARP